MWVLSTCAHVFVPGRSGAHPEEDVTPREIRAALVLADIKQANIARMLGVTRAAVSNTIAGRRRKPRIRQAIALAISKPVDAVWPPESENKCTTRKRAGNG